MWSVDAKDRGCDCRELCDECRAVVVDRARLLDAVFKKEWGCTDVVWYHHRDYIGAEIGDQWFKDLSHTDLSMLHRHLLHRFSRVWWHREWTLR